MESYLAISLLILGVTVGAGSTWLFWQRKLGRVEDQLEVAEENARRTIKQLTDSNAKLEEEIFAGEQQIERLDVELAAGDKRVAGLADELQSSHRQFRKMTEQLLECEHKLQQSEMERNKIPALESALTQKDDELAELRRELSELTAATAELKAHLAEEKRSLDECVIFVEGSHYLPGRVVRNLTGAKQP